ncbi:MAG: MaoC/PaaZ C-terminal domain-containing protein [Candidatus Metalachnospira sp.]|nr:MaoC/PaaZ C-terminal domain-containing protein [Candidatus Metalachnospira sp.]
MEARGIRFNDWVIGNTYETARRTVTESDITRFAGLSGDFNALHTDAVFAKSTPFGTNIAHGALIFSISTGLVDHSGFIEGSILAFLGAEINWPAPVIAGDTIHVELTPIEKKLTSNPKRGVVTYTINVLNQENTIVCSQKWKLMVLV